MEWIGALFIFGLGFYLGALVMSIFAAKIVARLEDRVEAAERRFTVHVQGSAPPPPPCENNVVPLRRR